MAENNIIQLDIFELGENVHLIKGNIPFTAREIVKSWYEQINDYNFDESKPVPGKYTEAFTQMIWKETIELGVSIAKA